MYTSNEISMYISSIVNSDNVITSETSYSYTYDDKGNITKIVYSSGEEIRYVYDDLGQLIREDNGLLDETYVYTYDNAGNILSERSYAYTVADTITSSVRSTNTYGYATSGWKDRLTSYNSHTITYDEIGNPLSYYNGVAYTFSWQGRRLTSAVKGGVTYSFTYNDSGVRTSKTKDGVTTTYYWNGTQLIAEETSGNITVYVYDADDSPIGMQYHSSSYADDVWDIYWYEKNLQGDIVAVYNNTGTRLVTYKYDAWGQHTTHYEASGGNTSVTKNPFRYRGYYYDIDLGLYYNISRYYDAYTGRFINADAYVSTGQGLLGYNMYAYCGNNPVIGIDDHGQMWQFVPALDPRNSTRGGGGGTFYGGSYGTSVATLSIASFFAILFFGAADTVKPKINAFDDSSENSQSKSGEGSLTNPPPQYNYWTAEIIDGLVVQGTPLTYSEARAWVASENNLLCRDHASAIAIVKFYPSAIWESAHKGGTKCGYLNHYHLNGAHSNHIWYYGDN